MARYATQGADGTTVPWRDKKRYLWILGLVVPLTPIVGIVVLWASSADSSEGADSPVA